MDNMTFQSMPPKYSSIINCIQSEIAKKIYSQFTYHYLNFTNFQDFRYHNQNSNKDKIIHFIFSHLQKYKFIIFNIYNFFPIICETMLPRKKSMFNVADVVFCVEGQCIIIEQIEFSIIKKIIANLKKNKISLINISHKIIDGYKTKEEVEVEEEILAFCKKINFNKNNQFIYNTFISILAYLIRRYFYPTDYFTNPSFFDFDQASSTNERIIKSKFIDLLNSKKSKAEDFSQIKNKAQTKKHCIDFEEKDFIILRLLSSSYKATFYLVFHIKSFYIFAMKKLNSPEQITSEKVNETNFNKKYTHRCLTHFYGYLKNDNKIIGYIYEYMSNGPLSSLKIDQNDKLFQLIIVNRILQGIDFFHSNKLIHRDLKPSNILIDHDFLPYISDFETIRHPKDEDDSLNQQMTNNIGSFLYSSPEQNKGESVSYPTDIYSFGLIIYFIFHNENLKKCNEVIDSINMKEKVEIKNFSKNIQMIFDHCYKIEPEARLNVTKIKSIFNIEFNEFLCEDSFLLDKKAQIIQFIYESLIIQNDVNDLFISLINYFLLSLEDKESKSNILFVIGSMYSKGIGVEQSYLKAKEYFELSAQQNNPEALNQLGTLYENGNGVEQNYAKAKECFELSAQQNNSDGLNHLAYLYYHGLGVIQNYAKAIEYYEKSAKQNNPEALDNLGYIYKNGIGVEPDYIKAKGYYELAAIQNNPYALNNLGNLYRDGLGVEVNYTKAKEYYELAIKQNNSFAFHNLGSLYEFGMGVEQSYDKAIKYYKLAAERKNTKALNNLGYFYFHGIGVEQSYTKAREYYEISATKKNSYSFLNLGIIYANGLGVEQSFSKAKEYYELSIKQNNSDALNNLGNLYANGLGVDVDYIKAKEYYELSKKQNNTDALVYLGNLYANGFGVEKSYSKAKELFEESAEKNNPKAFNCLGVLYEKGYGVEQSYSKAIEYYEKAAKKNNSDAFNNLGYLYENGLGFPKSYSKARAYYEISAQQSNPEALNNLGIIHAYGLGVEKSYLKAKKYFEMSSKLNNSDALNNLAHLYINGWGVEQSYSKAKELFELSAKQNNSDAFVYLGILYKKGYEVTQSYSKAKEYFEKAAKQNNSKALNNLACLYYFGLGVEQSHSKAIEYYELSAKLNDPIALNNLGYLYLNVNKCFDKAINCFSLSCKQNNLIAYLNIGDIYCDSIHVKSDYSESLKYYQKAAQQNNSEALFKLGNLYFEGKGIQKDFQKALKYYEQSAEKNNSNALNKLGDIYFNGFGVEKDYQKAKKYYDKSALLLNSDALLQIGKIYYNGKGVEPNFLRAEEYYILSVQYGNPDALFFLGDFHSNGNFFNRDISKAIQYFLRSIQIHYDQKEVNNKVDKMSFIKNIYNNYFYHSYNDLGLIYLTLFDDVEKACHFIKEAAFMEYPFGQNNYAILNEIYLNDIIKAEYMYSKSSKNNFPLADYNLGRLREKNGKLTIESIEYYKKASDNEDSPLMFRNREHHDKRLEISKTFVICLTNLKLADYYLSLSNLIECKKYFVRALKKLNVNIEFLRINKENADYFFSYLKDCIFNFPSFNLINQPNLSKKIKFFLLDCHKKSSHIVNNYDMTNLYGYDNDNDNKTIKLKTLENDSREDLGDIFDFIISNQESKNIFVNEIKGIIKTMLEIIHTPPYQILFGRINIEKPKEITNPNIKYINALFYEGFGFNNY